MEDLSLEFPLLKQHCNFKEALVVVDWLAKLHAQFLGKTPEGLWPIGTYWHLETRQDEFTAMEDSPLKANAQKIDNKLNVARYKTIVHGDAKVANFCFSKDLKQVAAVDFQYVGGGCGIKDVIYLMGSCLTDNECEKHESELLDFYFKELNQALLKSKSSIDFAELEKEWRSLYPIAWTDFTRFLLGWMPTHQKLNRYSYHLLEQTISQFYK